MKKFLTLCLVLAVTVLPAGVKAGPPIGANNDGGVDAVVLPEDAREGKTLPAAPTGGVEAIVLPTETPQAKAKPPAGSR
jgi:hypothetical protein